MSKMRQFPLCLAAFVLFSAFISIPLHANAREFPVVDLPAGEDLLLEDRIEAASTPLEEKVQIEVVLIGFGDHNLDVRELSRYLTSQSTHSLVEAIHVRHPVGDADDDEFDSVYEDTRADWKAAAYTVGLGGVAEREGDSHHIGVERKFVFRVVNGGDELELNLRTEINRKLDNGKLQLSYQTVDDVLKADYALRRDQGYVFYVFDVNPSAPNAYAYAENDDVEWSSCGSTNQAGRERYMWVDLTAGPVEMGPRTTGEGLVSTATMPYIHLYEGDGINEDKENEEKSKRQLSLDLVSFIRRTCDFLIAPSMDHLPQIDPLRTLYVHFVLIHDHKVGEKERFDLFNYEKIKDEMARIPVFEGQSVVFRRTDVSLMENHFAAAAYAHALKSHSTVVMQDNRPTSHVHQYLDADELHVWLRRFLPELLEGEGSSSSLRDWRRGEAMNADDDELEFDENIVPVFLFDFSYSDVTLLNRYDQVRSYPDMVIGVQIESKSMTYDFKCGGASTRVDPRDATRPLLGAVLTSAYGVCPTHLCWSAATGRVRTDYSWAVGRTPFGVFSSSSDLSFAQVDSAVKNQLYALLNNTQGELLHSLHAFSTYGAELYDALATEEYLEYIQRWNLFHSKLQKSVEDISLGNFDGAMNLIVNAQHDLRELKLLKRKATDDIRSILNCQTARNAPITDSPVKILHVLAPLSSVALLAAFAVCYLRPLAQKTFGPGLGGKKKRM